MESEKLITLVHNLPTSNPPTPANQDREVQTMRNINSDPIIQ